VPTNQTASATVLLVDDTKSNRYILSRILKTAGYEVIEATTGHEALSFAEKEKPSLVMLDVGLPDLDGREVCRRLKRNPLTALLPVIQMSAKFTDDKNSTEALEGGADGYLIQPIEPSVLIATVRALIRLSKVESERAQLLENERMARLEAESERQKLEQAIRVRDEFLSMASHELKTPLTSLQLQNQIQRRNLNKGDRTQLDPKEMMNSLERQGRQFNRLGRLIDDMLDIARISSGKLSLNIEEINLSDVVLEILDRFKPEFESAGCELITNIQSNIVGSLDSFRSEQILVNLFTNVIKYAQGAPVYVDLIKNQDTGVIKVSDNGMGISKENQARIFNRFERAVSYREVGGLGLGLYILKEIVNAHGGSVTVESEPKKGAIFTVTLPLHQKKVDVGSGMVFTPDEASANSPLNLNETQQA
jgi:signal transduction histidine kinase